MTDKDLLVVVSEMLKKQDRHSELMQETNETLKKFIEISINQFEQQMVFNEKQQVSNQQQRVFNEQQLASNEKQQAFSELQQASNEKQLTFNDQQREFNEKQLSFNERQEEFNEKFLDQNKLMVDRLDNIEKLLVHVVDMDDRIKRLEAAVFK